MNNNMSSETTCAAPDYSKAECWYKIPEITREVDTFYIYATEYIMGSFEEGAPDYATLDNAEMLLGVKNEYRDHASTSAEIAKAGAEFFGPDGRHAYDYMYYYNNIKDNAAKRVTAYLNNRT